MLSQPYKIRKYLLAITAAWSIVPGTWNPFSPDGDVLRAQIPRITTKFQVDPFWPKPLPNDWVMGNVGGVCVNSQDQVFVLERTADPLEKNPAQAVEYGPPVLEYGHDGDFLNAWGDPKVVPTEIHNCHFDREGNIWIAGTRDAVVQKYIRDGKLLLQIGTRLRFDSSDGTIAGKALESSHELLNRPTAVAEDPFTGDLYVADGEGNHRVAVFDHNGKYLRQFGRGATTAEAAEGVGGVFASTVHCLVLSNDGLLYVCDREGYRIQVFDKTGGYKKSMYLPRRNSSLPGHPQVTWIVFSRDKTQKYLYVGTPEGLVWTVERESGKAISAFGRHGTMAGEFYLHDMAINSKGDLFIAEVGGRRVQKFEAVGRD